MAPFCLVSERDACNVPSFRWIRNHWSFNLICVSCKQIKSHFVFPSIERSLFFLGGGEGGVQATDIPRKDFILSWLILMLSNSSHLSQWPWYFGSHTSNILHWSRLLSFPRWSFSLSLHMRVGNFSFWELLIANFQPLKFKSSLVSLPFQIKLKPSGKSHLYWILLSARSLVRKSYSFLFCLMRQEISLKTCTLFPLISIFLSLTSFRLESCTSLLVNLTKISRGVLPSS